MSVTQEQYLADLRAALVVKGFTVSGVFGKVGDLSDAIGAVTFTDIGAGVVAGTVWYEGHGVPASSLGVSGDFYLDVDTGDVYKKTGSSWGASVGNLKGPTGTNGTNGTNGADGKTVLNGAGAPGAVGNLGDFYIDTTASTIYGPKSGGGWGSSTDLVGAQGPAGPAPSGTGYVHVTVGVLDTPAEITPATIGAAADQKSILVVTGDYAITAGDSYDIIVCDSVTSMGLILPTPGKKKILYVKSIGTGAVTVDAGVGNVIEDQQTQVVRQWDCMEVVDYSASAWVIL
jgi:hypothetical protein